MNVSKQRTPKQVTWPYALEMIDKNEIEIDPAYQRPRQDKIIKNIQADFDPVAFGALPVSRRDDGKVWAIDGQQRHAATLDMPEITLIPCLVYPGSNQKSEARDFLLINSNRKAVSPIDKFKARSTAGETIPVEVDAFLRENGYKVTADSGPKAIRCIQTLQAAWKKDSKAVRAIWPVLEQMHRAEQISIQVFKAVFQLQLEEKLTQELADYLGKSGAQNARIKIKAASDAKGVGGSKATVWAEALRKDFAIFKKTDRTISQRGQPDSK